MEILATAHPHATSGLGPVASILRLFPFGPWIFNVVIHFVFHRVYSIQLQMVMRHSFQPIPQTLWPVLRTIQQNHFPSHLWIPQKRWQVKYTHNQLDGHMSALKKIQKMDLHSYEHSYHMNTHKITVYFLSGGDMKVVRQTWAYVHVRGQREMGISV